MFAEGVKMRSGSISSLATTVAALMRIDPPRSAQSPPLETVIREAQRVLHGQPVERCLVFSPDAIGNHLDSFLEEELGILHEICSVRVSVRSVIPPKTPVCFSSMLTGAGPEVHGIRQYERPVVMEDTLFDSLIRAGVKASIVAVRDSSMDLMFREREMEYFTEVYDPETVSRTRMLMDEDNCGLIMCYQQEYDDLLHRTGPFAEPALKAARRHVDDFRQLALAASVSWRHRNHALVFAPDHGAHVDAVTGRGTHGDDIPEDMDLDHWYCVRKGE
jgi:hypothetical protein